MNPFPEAARTESGDLILLRAGDLQTLVDAAQGASARTEISIDLGKGTTPVTIDLERRAALFPSGPSLHFEEIPKIRTDRFYYLDTAGQPRPLHFFSEETGKVYKLLPTRDWPSFSISSAPMHQITFSSPKQETQAKIELIGPFDGNETVLDCCFGLGYLAAAVSERVRSVLSYEVDSNVLALGRINPYSRPAFSAPKLELRQGDVYEEIQSLPSGRFDVLFHDPPTPRLAPLLYSAEFYRSVKRVLKPGGRLFHYTPRPNIRVRKRNFPAEIRRRLIDQGFDVLSYSDEAQGYLVRPRK